MSVTLGHHQYGKAETRVVRVYPDTATHEIANDNGSVALSGDFAEFHLLGDNAKLPDPGRLRPAFDPGQGW
jgi:urate oxidase